MSRWAEWKSCWNCAHEPAVLHLSKHPNYRLPILIMQKDPGGSHLFAETPTRSFPSYTHTYTHTDTTGVRLWTHVIIRFSFRQCFQAGEALWLFCSFCLLTLSLILSGFRAQWFLNNCWFSAVGYLRLNNSQNMLITRGPLLFWFAWHCLLPEYQLMALICER